MSKYKLSKAEKVLIDMDAWSIKQYEDDIRRGVVKKSDVMEAAMEYSGFFKRLISSD